MPTSKKIIAFDLDGTLAESKQPLEQAMAQALATLASQAKVAIVSGGSMEQYKKQFLPFFIEFAADKKDCFENLILMPTSGTEWYQYDDSQKTWVLTERETFPEETKQKVHAILIKMIASGRHDIPEESYGERVEDRGNQITLSALGQAAPIEKKKLWDPDQKKRQVMKAEFEAEISDVSVSIGGTTSVDILPKGFTKAVGLKRLLAKLGYAETDLLYAGDALFPGGNDYSVAEAGLETIQVSGPQETLSHIERWIGK